MNFSRRYGYGPHASESQPIREDAPESVRAGFLAIVERHLTWGQLRAIICKVLRKRAEESNWSEEWIRPEVEALLYEAPWYRFYDCVEAVMRALPRTPRYNQISDGLLISDDLENPLPSVADDVLPEVNQLFAEENVAWRVIGNDVVLHTGEASDDVLLDAVDALDAAGRATAASELRKAIHALSTRPEPDTRDAVRCVLGSMEAVARDVTGDSKATLGDILKRKGDALLAPPLPEAFAQIWGYGSNFARHVAEDRAPSIDEAVLVVGIVAAGVAYLNRRTPKSGAT